MLICLRDSRSGCTDACFANDFALRGGLATASTLFESVLVGGVNLTTPSGMSSIVRQLYAVTVATRSGLDSPSLGVGTSSGVYIELSSCTFWNGVGALRRRRPLVCVRAGGRVCAHTLARTFGCVFVLVTRWRVQRRWSWPSVPGVHRLAGAVRGRQVQVGGGGGRPLCRQLCMRVRA